MKKRFIPLEMPLAIRILSQLHPSWCPFSVWLGQQCSNSSVLTSSAHFYWKCVWKASSSRFHSKIQGKTQPVRKGPPGSVDIDTGYPARYTRYTHHQLLNMWTFVLSLDIAIGPQATVVLYSAVLELGEDLIIQVARCWMKVNDTVRFSIEVLLSRSQVEIECEAASFLNREHTWYYPLTP